MIRDFKPKVFVPSLSPILFLFGADDWNGPVLDLSARWACHVSLAIFGIRLILLSSLCFTCGVALDTIANVKARPVFNQNKKPTHLPALYAPDI